MRRSNHVWTVGRLSVDGPIERKRLELSDPDLYVECIGTNETGEQIVTVSVWRIEASSDRVTVAGRGSESDATERPPERRRPAKWKTPAR
jgi:hypothetical protein